MEYVPGSGLTSASVVRAFPSPGTNWQIDAGLQVSNLPSYIVGAGGNIAFEIADSGGHLIVQAVITTSKLVINGVTFIDLTMPSPDNGQFLNQLYPINIFSSQYFNGVLTVSYGAVTHALIPITGSTPIAPSSFAVRFNSVSGDNEQSVDISSLKVFVPTSAFDFSGGGGGGTISTIAAASSNITVTTPAGPTTTLELGNTIKLGVASTTPGILQLANASNANITSLQAGVGAAVQTYQLPTILGTAGQVLAINAVGPPTTLNWVTPASGGAVSSVTGSAGVTVSPTTGAVVASLNLGYAPTWTATHTFNATIDLPNTTGSGIGVITKGGTPFIHNAKSAAAGNTFLGSNAGNFGVTGALNVGLGNNALLNITSGNQNMAMGAASLQGLTSGTNNIGIGYTTLIAYNGNSSTAIGNVVMPNATSGDNNTSIGANSGNGLVTGASNTLIGAGAGYSLGTNDSNNTIIGRWTSSAGKNGVIVLADGLSQRWLDYNESTLSVWTFAAPIVLPGGTNAFLTSATAITTGAGSSAGTLSNAPVAGNPTKWIKINDAGTTRYIPAW